uniref:Anti-FecI sigma factor, FecR n=1 Tax=Sphingobacterium sp. (strain 21) TaxID=743722 RepID=F4C867_SPHS2
MLDKDLFKRFLENKCNAEEAELVANYLKTHPEAFELLLPETEWEQTLQEYSYDKKHRVYRLSPWIYKAAIVLLSLGAIHLLYERQRDQKKVLIQNKEIATIGNSEVKENISDKTLFFTLEDGSDIQLEPNSKIEFPIDFTSNRTITLTGMAVFNVANDPEHPFKVLAKDVETTVLGTRFEISAFPKQDQVSVRLLTGKISVRNKNHQKRTILIPGQQYTLTPTGSSVTNFRRKELKKTNKPLINTTSTVTRKGDSLLFDKQPLSFVFTVLSKEFDTPINFNKDAVRKKFFTGYVIKSRSLEKELTNIVLMNKLTLENDTTNHRLLIK